MVGEREHNAEWIGMTGQGGRLPVASLYYRMDETCLQFSPPLGGWRVGPVGVGPARQPQGRGRPGPRVNPKARGTDCRGAPWAEYSLRS
jgi:hypothetical protein